MISRTGLRHLCRPGAEDWPWQRDPEKVPLKVPLDGPTHVPMRRSGAARGAIKPAPRRYCLRVQFELQRWRGLNDALLREDDLLTSDLALDILHRFGQEHGARDLLRALNQDNDARKPFWTMAESAAWDMRGRFASRRLGSSIIGTVPGRELCLQLANTDIGYYLTSYAMQDSPPFEEAVRSMHTAGGGALAWGVVTSATKFVDLVARDERLSSFFKTWFDEDSDEYYLDPNEVLALDRLNDSGMIERLATHANPGLLSDLLETSAVAEVADVLESLDGGSQAVSLVAEALRKRCDSPLSRTDEIYHSTLVELDPLAGTASVLIGATIAQLTAIPAGIALVVALSTHVESDGSPQPAAAGTIFGLLEELIAELERAVHERHAESLRRLEEIASHRDVALDVFAWAIAEHARLSALCEQLRAERDLLGEQLRAEQRRRQLETGLLRSDIDDSLRQQGLDGAVIRELNAYIDSRQRRRLREALRDVIAGASLGGTLYGSAGAIAGGILGLLGAAVDDAGD